MAMFADDVDRDADAFFDCYVDTDSTSPIVNGWENEIGFLNNNLHRIQNNEYYQNF